MWIERFLMRSICVVPGGMACAAIGTAGIVWPGTTRCDMPPSRAIQR